MQTGHTKDGPHSLTGSVAVLRVPRVAETLDISVRSVWRLISIGELEVVRIGKSVRVTDASLRAFIQKGGSR